MRTIQYSVALMMSGGAAAYWMPRLKRGMTAVCGTVARHCDKREQRPSPLSFRDGPKDQTRNLEIPGSMLRIAPE